MVPQLIIEYIQDRARKEAESKANIPNPYHLSRMFTPTSWHLYEQRLMEANTRAFMKSMGFGLSTINKVIL